jgi:hypothetical protein
MSIRTMLPTLFTSTSFVSLGILMVYCQRIWKSITAWHNNSYKFEHYLIIHAEHFWKIKKNHFLIKTQDVLFSCHNTCQLHFSLHTTPSKSQQR